MLSIIIPTLNCRDELVRTLDAFALRPPAWEIVISDGGSTDGTLEAAELAGARTLVGPAGRGRQSVCGSCFGMPTRSHNPAGYRLWNTLYATRRTGSAPAIAVWY